MKNLFGYEIIQTLGQGKTGTAYLVEKNNSQFVLKKMNEQTEITEVKNVIKEMLVD